MSSDKENQDTSQNVGYKAGERPPHQGTTLPCSAPAADHPHPGARIDMHELF